MVGTGSTGGPETFGLMGLGYMAIIGTTAFVHRLPPPAVSAAALPAAPDGVSPEKQQQDQEAAVAAAPVAFNVLPSVAIRTPQFWAMYLGFGLSISGAYGIISSGRCVYASLFFLHFWPHSRADWLSYLAAG